jgi:hypothetical protein
MSDTDYAALAYKIMPKFFAAGGAVEKTINFLIEVGCNPEDAKTYAVEALDRWTDLWTNN